MMHDMFIWVLAALIGLVWIVGHAVQTLYRLQGKVVYPLLRVRSKEGQDTSVVRERGSGPALRWPTAMHTLC